MKRINSLVCTAAVMLILGTAVSYRAIRLGTCITCLSYEWANIGAGERRSRSLP